jgi:VWFA-related protein
VKTILCLALVFAPGCLGFQDQNTPIKVDVEVVNVLCTVYDNHGALVKDLRKEDFEIRENGRRQEIRYFARETDLPLTVALLVDVSGSVRRVIEDERDAAGQFFDAVLRPTDHALLLGFSSTMVLWQDFTSSSALLRQGLAALRAVPFRGLPRDSQPMPGTLLYDAVFETANSKLKRVPGRKAMLVISDGLDNGSRKHLEDAVEAVQSTNTSLYGICYESGFSGCSYLKSLAEPTGGRMFQAGRKTPLTAIFQTIGEDLRSQYALGFIPANRARDGLFRKLDVKVHPKGLNVRARKGYYAAADTER